MSTSTDPRPSTPLGDHRVRLTTLLADEGTEVPPPVLDHLRVVEEEMAVADEELRVQQEELAASRSALEALAARYRELFAGAAAPMVVTDRFGVVLELNRAATALLGKAGAAPLRRPLVNRFELCDRQAARSLIIKALNRRRPVQDCFRIHAPSGASVPVTVRITTFVDATSSEPRLSWELGYDGMPTDTSTADPGTDGRGENAFVRSGDHAADGAAAGSAAPPESALASAIRTLMLEDLDGNPVPDFDPEVIAERVTTLAKRLIPSTHWATVSVLSGRGRLTTLAATDPRAGRLDVVQQRVGEGPAVRALADRRVVRVADVRHVDDWPRFGPLAGEAGARAAISCHFPVLHALGGAVTLYSAKPGSFGPAADVLVPLLAARAATALGYADKIANLQVAVDSRQVIGQACGILMERHKITAEAAFETMVSASQNRHVKLRELATKIVETGVGPDTV